MLVSAKLVASTWDAGVEETGLSFVVVADLGRAAVTPWVAFHVSGLRMSVFLTGCERCVRDGLEVAAGLVLGLIVGCQAWRSIGAQVP